MLGNYFSQYGRITDAVVGAPENPCVHPWTFGGFASEWNPPETGDSSSTSCVDQSRQEGSTAQMISIWLDDCSKALGVKFWLDVFFLMVRLVLKFLSCGVGPKMSWPHDASRRCDHRLRTTKRAQ